MCLHGTLSQRFLAALVGTFCSLERAAFAVCLQINISHLKPPPTHQHTSKHNFATFMHNSMRYAYPRQRYTYKMTTTQRESKIEDEKIANWYLGRIKSFAWVLWCPTERAQNSKWAWLKIPLTPC